MSALHHRLGITRIELLVVVAIGGLATVIAVPAIQAARESARLSSCRHNLAQISTALGNYHDSFNVFPAGAVWRPGLLGSLALYEAKRIDVITYDNWALNLLPYLDEQSLASHWQRDLPIAAPENKSVRESSVSKFSCPVDTYNRKDNFYRLEFGRDVDEARFFARGNYAFNCGSESGGISDGDIRYPLYHPAPCTIDEDRGEYRDVCSGIGGINFWLSRDGIVNGASTMVALEELRAGIDPIDPRGVWAFGQVGGSLTRGHGVAGDDYGPNNQWHRADDIRGCGDLHRRLGQEALTQARMPCVHYIDSNGQATSRSLHPGGVNVAFLDGHVRFVSDGIDPGLWHMLHSRGTPPSIFPATVEKLTSRPRDMRQAALPAHSPIALDAPMAIENRLGMRFVLVPSGEFQMGVADVSQGPPPLECPTHSVKISQPFYLGATEVTQGQYESIMGNNPSHHTSAVTGVSTTADFPVESVSWYDADEFCKRLSASDSETISGRTYRLPTEAEWEYVCREGKSDRYTLPIETVARSTGEIGGSSIFLPLGEVGRYAPNKFGIYDMRGSVWEWSNDWFDRQYYSRSPTIDPQGPASGFIKLARGNNWIFIGISCMNNVQVYTPWSSSPYIGFRVVCENAK